jgi:hypothetical protein
MDKTQNLQNVEFRTRLDLRVLPAEGDAMPTIVGTAVPFNVVTQLWEDLFERINVSAFSQSLAEDDNVYALVGHDHNKPLGRKGAGTLSIREDPGGLAVTILPPNTQIARDAIESIRRGDIDGMSIGMEVEVATMAIEDGLMIRTVERAKLRDVSVTTFAAYGTTEVALRSLAVFKQEQAALAEVGMPAKLARQKLDLLVLTSP